MEALTALVASILLCRLNLTEADDFPMHLTDRKRLAGRPYARLGPPRPPTQAVDFLRVIVEPENWEYWVQHRVRARPGVGGCRARQSMWRSIAERETGIAKASGSGDLRF